MTRPPRPPESPPPEPSASLAPRVQKEPNIELPAVETDAATRAKQEEFIDRVYRPYEGMVHMYVGLSVDDASKVKDRAQEVFLNAWKYDLVTRCGGEAGCIKANLLTIASNCVTDQYRRERRDKKRNDRYALEMDNAFQQPSDYVIKS